MDRIEIPTWAKEYLKQQRCPDCHTAFTEDDVHAAGNRIKNDKPYYFCAAKCRKCHKKVTMTIMTRSCAMWELAGYLNQIVDEMNCKAKDPSLAPSRLPDSRIDPISDAEARAITRDLEECSDHAAFLQLIGLTPQEIKQYTTPIKTTGKTKKLPPKLPPKRRRKQ
jgi:hypothetical protein